MADFTDAPCLGVVSRKDDHPVNYQMSRRTPAGRQFDTQTQPRNSIAFGMSGEYDTSNDGSINIEAQCTDCVMEVEDEHGKDDTVQPLAALDSYQTGSSSIHTGETEEHKGPREAAKKDSERSGFNPTAVTEYHRTSTKEPPFGKEAALIEYMIAEYASLVDSDLDLGCVDTRYERPRAAPAVPKRDLPDSLKERGSISTKVSTRSDPVSRNFRRLRLDIQHPNRSGCRSQSDQDSPDWACETSLAIEAGKIGMDGIHMHSAYSNPVQESSNWVCRKPLALEAGTISMDSIHTYSGYASPRHILDTIRSPIKVILPERKRVQSLGQREMQVAHSSPFSRHSWTHSSANRHSEGALQIALREKGPRLVGKDGKMDIAVGDRPLRRGCIQVVPPMDLNKSLPALPSQPCEQNDNEQSEPL